MTPEGLITLASRFGTTETLLRLRSSIEAKGHTLFAVIDHARNALEAGLSLRPSTVLIFGNAKAGTTLMQANQAMSLDLPLRVLVSEDAGGKTWLSYNDPAWLAGRYGLTGDAAAAAEKISAGLSALVKDVAGISE